MQKYGRVRGVQRYRCHSCGKQFKGGERRRPEELWREYQQGKQTYAQLAKAHGCAARTIQRCLDRYEPKATVAQVPKGVVLLMDTTYFRRGFGVMLFRDATTGQNLYRQYVKYETNQLYAEGIAQLRSRGVRIMAVVCDGRRGLFQLCGDVPVQMCQFHQMAIITRYLTRKPKLPAAQQLRELVMILARTDKESFIGGLAQWLSTWQGFLNERSTDTVTGRSHYTHRRLRSAYLSVKRNLPWLFIWYDHPGLRIPNTTNAIDGHFAHLKNSLRNHNGLSEPRKRKFIDEFLKAWGSPIENKEQ